MRYLRLEGACIYIHHIVGRDAEGSICYQYSMLSIGLVQQKTTALAVVSIIFSNDPIPGDFVRAYYCTEVKQEWWTCQLWNQWQWWSAVLHKTCPSIILDWSWLECRADYGDVLSPTWNGVLWSWAFEAWLACQWVQSLPQPHNILHFLFHSRTRCDQYPFNKVFPLMQARSHSKLLMPIKC